MPKSKSFRKAKKGSAGKQALKKVNMLIKNQELKKIDNQDSTNVQSAGDVVLLSGLATGITGSTREGNAVSFKSLSFKYFITNNTTSGESICRIMIVQDNQVNGALFTIGDLLEDTGINANIVSPSNLDNSRRFRILYNKVIVTTEEVNTFAYRELYKKMNMYARYSGAGSDITGVESKGLFLVLLSNQATNQPSIEYQCRLRFSDG